MSDHRQHFTRQPNAVDKLMDGSPIPADVLIRRGPDASCCRDYTAAEISDDGTKMTFSWTSEDLPANTPPATATDWAWVGIYFTCAALGGLCVGAALLGAVAVPVAISIGAALLIACCCKVGYRDGYRDGEHAGRVSEHDWITRAMEQEIEKQKHKRIDVKA